MKTLLRAGIAIVIIVGVTHYLENPRHSAQFTHYKNEILQSRVAQTLQQLPIIQNMNQFEMRNVIPYDAL